MAIETAKGARWGFLVAAILIGFSVGQAWAEGKLKWLAFKDVPDVRSYLTKQLRDQRL